MNEGVSINQIKPIADQQSARQCSDKLINQPEMNETTSGVARC
ncbi:hypothetical protein SynBIOSU31_02034 [Synechococcus sp. BIOS-U3-1]|nr:hypothetical protein SynBIOSU31_02034 [Synechococcus sp. BIOS-U3-1]